MKLCNCFGTALEMKKDFSQDFGSGSTCYPI